LIEKLAIPDDLKHIAIIMDGNGRWAKNKTKERLFGHKSGSNAVEKIATACAKMGLEVLSLFAFSTENWNRPKKEVNALMDLFADFIKQKGTTILDNNMRFKLTGELYRLPENVQELVEDLVLKTSKNTGMILNLAVSYGGRLDITEAVKKISKDVLEGIVKADDITEDTISNNLWTAGLPDPDLLIRTAGEYRISNFMIWQMAYSEIYISKVLWPDFDELELAKAIDSYSKRERRFGKVKL
jgi:undecaprenyl diphosphate synthase